MIDGVLFWIVRREPCCRFRCSFGYYIFFDCFIRTIMQNDRGRSKSSSKVDKQIEITFGQRGWSYKERVKLMVFLSFYAELQQWGSERNKIMICKHLSKFIKSKTPQQCKNIMTYLQKKYIRVQDISIILESLLDGYDDFIKYEDRYKKNIASFEEIHGLKDGQASIKKANQSSSARASRFQNRAYPRRESRLGPSNNLRITFDPKENKIEKIQKLKQPMQTLDFKIRLQEIGCEEKSIQKAIIEDQEQKKEEDVTKSAQFLKDKQTLSKLGKQCQLYYQEWVKACMVLQFKTSIKK